MPDGQNMEYQLFSDNLRLYNAMIDDIEKARDYVHIETYKYGNDPIGRRMREVLAKKSKQGVEVKVLIDSWGTSVGDSFFSMLTQNGGEVRFFQKLEWGLVAIFTKNHKRDHRKLLLIDDHISYIGSANFSDYSITWRESTLRITGDLAVPLKKIFLMNYRLYKRKIFRQFPTDRIRRILNSIRTRIYHDDFEIIPDSPSSVDQPVKKKFLQLIRSAKHSLIIETPYFLPSGMLRRALSNAARRGVDVKVIVPARSDVALVDILRRRYLGPLHQSGVKIFYYLPHNLHSKIMLVDNQTFSIGSANFDYRSFRFQYEIILVGKDRSVMQLMNAHVSKTLEECELFDYAHWEKRLFMQKFVEWLLVPIRHWF